MTLEQLRVIVENAKKERDLLYNSYADASDIYKTLAYSAYKGLYDGYIDIIEVSLFDTVKSASKLKRARALLRTNKEFMKNSDIFALILICSHSKFDAYEIIENIKERTGFNAYLELINCK